MTRKRQQADPRELPIYQLAQAARYLHLPPATLRAWVAGRTWGAGRGYSEPLIERPDPADDRLSFTNLIEAHVLRALRVEHRVPMQAVRRSLEYAQREFGIDRLLIKPELRAAPGELFLAEYGRLLSLSRTGQFAMEKILESYLRRISRDVAGLPIRLYPFTLPDHADSAAVVAIDPRISFGRPVIARKGVTTSILAERLNSGETVPEIAYDYGLNEEEVTEALVYERVA